MPETSTPSGGGPGSLTESRRIEFLNRWCNHEAQILTATMVAAQPDVPFTGTLLRDEYVRRQGTPPIGRSASLINGLADYCERGLVPTGAVIKTQAWDKETLADAYQATPEGAQELLTMSGAFIRWSVKYPDVSVQHVLGKTTGGVDQDSPEVRFKIYRHLLAPPSPKVSVADIVRMLDIEPYHPVSATGQVDRLARLGILAVNSKWRDFNPTFTLSGPRHYFLNLVNDHRTTAATKVLYKTLADLHTAETTQYTLRHILDHCQGLNPDVDLPIIRRYLLHNRRPGVTLERDEDYDPNRLTDVTIHPDFRGPIAELYELMQSLGDSDTAREYQEFALAAIDNQENFRTMVTKARKFTSHGRVQAGEAEHLNMALLKIVSGLGSVSVEQALQLVMEEQSRILDRATVDEALRRLSKMGKLVGEKRQTDPSKRRKITHYKLSPYCLLFEGEQPFDTGFSGAVLSVSALTRQLSTRGARSPALRQHLATVPNIVSDVLQTEAEDLRAEALNKVVSSIFSQWEVVRAKKRLTPLLEDSTGNARGLIIETAVGALDVARHNHLDPEKTEDAEIITNLVVFWGPAFAKQWLDGTILREWAARRSVGDPEMAKRLEDLFTPANMRYLALRNYIDPIGGLDKIASNYFSVLSYRELAARTGWTIDEATELFTPGRRKWFAINSIANPLKAIDRLVAHMSTTLSDDNLAAHLGWTTARVAATFTTADRRLIAVGYPRDPLRMIDKVKVHLETTLTDESLVHYLNLPVGTIQKMFVPSIRSYFAVRYVNDPLKYCQAWIDGKLNIGHLMSDRARRQRLAAGTDTVEP